MRILPALVLLLIASNSLAEEAMTATHGLAAHFLAAAKHHPQGGVPLNFDSNYDAPRRFMRVTFSGSVFAIAYFATLLELRLTQRQDRETRHAS